ncbi:Rv1733c family protein [Nocardia sp. MW-W600-9]
MSGYPSMPVRWWRRRPWSSNPLMRPSDRWEVILWMVVVLVVLAAIPVAGAVGSAAYVDAGDRIRTENIGKVPAMAMVLESPTRTAAVSPRGIVTERYSAPATWSTDGRSGTAIVETDASVAAGDTVPMWLSGDGLPTSAPQSPSAAVAAGIGAGLVLLCEIAAGVLAFAWIVSWLLVRQHRAGWAREWDRIGAGRDERPSSW